MDENAKENVVLRRVRPADVIGTKVGDAALLVDDADPLATWVERQQRACASRLYLVTQERPCSYEHADPHLDTTSGVTARTPTRGPPCEPAQRRAAALVPGARVLTEPWGYCPMDN